MEKPRKALPSGTVLAMVAAIAAFTSLSGCKKDAAGSAPQGLAGVRAAIVAHNYTEAAELARKEAARHAADPAARFELARAEALAGNQGRALDALDAALKAGLADAGRALEDPAFDAVRGDPRFAQLVERASPSSAGGPAGEGAVAVMTAGKGTDGVAIREDAGGTHIQAGDVKLDTDF